MHTVGICGEIVGVARTLFVTYICGHLRRKGPAETQLANLYARVLAEKCWRYKPQIISLAYILQALTLNLAAAV